MPATVKEIAIFYAVKNLYIRPQMMMQPYRMANRCQDLQRLINLYCHLFML